MICLTKNLYAYKRSILEGKGTPISAQRIILFTRSSSCTTDNTEELPSFLSNEPLLRWFMSVLLSMSNLFEASRWNNIPLWIKFTAFCSCCDVHCTRIPKEKVFCLLIFQLKKIKNPKYNGGPNKALLPLRLARKLGRPFLGKCYIYFLHP